MRYRINNSFTRCFGWVLGLSILTPKTYYLPGSGIRIRPINLYSIVLPIDVLSIDSTILPLSFLNNTRVFLSQNLLAITTMKLLLSIAANFCWAYSVTASGGVNYQGVLMNSPAAGKPILPPHDHIITTDPVHQTILL